MLTSVRRAILGGGAGYYGPGDVVPSASFWLGLRAYNRAYALNGGACIDVVKTSDGTATKTIFLKRNGSLDVSTISALGYGVSVTKIYDQTGNGHHFTQATLSAMPTITLATLSNYWPVLHFVSASSQFLADVSTLTQSNPFTTSMVAVGTQQASSTWFARDVAASLGMGIGYLSTGTANTAFAYQGSFPNFTLSNNSYHAVQVVFNAASSTVKVDSGAPGSISTGANTLSSATIRLGGSTAGGTFLGGNVQEFGLWNGAISTGDQTTMNSNQHSYWGF